MTFVCRQFGLLLRRLDAKETNYTAYVKTKRYNDAVSDSNAHLKKNAGQSLSFDVGADNTVEDNI